ncbi:MAG: PAS domain S-box protein [Planctomycetes bacterium]|nr:PAS domain S-box protein [Planctomycetota bacterium]
MAENPARILLISDTDGEQNLLADALNRCQTPLDCRRVSSVSDALDLPDEATFDLILLDGNGGGDSYPDIAGRHRRTPLLLLVEPENGDAALDAVRRTACDLLIKDTEGSYLQVLPLKIQNLLAMHNAHTHATDEQLAHQRLNEYEELVRANESLRQEIADRIKTEEALKESMERYRIISRLSSDYFYSLSINDGRPGHIEWLAGAFETITGYKPDEITNVDEWLCVIHPDDVQKVLLNANTLKTGSVSSMEYRITTKQGTRRWLSDRTSPVLDEKTQALTSIIGAVRDITEQKLAIEALKESEIRFKAIFENAGGAIFIADTETGQIIECNTKAEVLTGRARDDIIGLHQLQLHPKNEADKYDKMFRQHIELRQTTDFESKVKHIDGRIIPVWISAQVMTIKGKEVLMGLFIDVTEKKCAEEERTRLMEVLEAKNAELESIIHVTSHDFRTPMITIAGFSGELDRSCRQLQGLLDEENNDFKTSSRPVIREDIPEAVELIKASTAKLASLLDGMQRLAKLDHSAMQKDTFDMNDMIGEIIKTISFQVKEDGVRINVEPLPDCFGDEQQINQVFSNLLANAINYLDPDKSGIITVAGWLAEGNLVYCVKDNGIGIEKRNLADIFKMYYLIDPEKSQGEGLGLAIVRRVVNRHNGKVWAESQPGKGSRFYVALPAS